MGGDMRAGRAECDEHAGCDPTWDRLSREVSYLIGPGPLTAEEAEAFVAVLDGLYPQAGECRQERSRMARMPAADHATAFRRMEYGV